MSFKHEPISVGYDDLYTTNAEGEGRKYLTPDGKKYPSMTNVLSVRAKDYLTEWRNRVGDAEADRVCHHGVTRGSALHLLAEKHINNEDVDLRKEMPHVVQSFGVVRKILDAHVDRIMAQEVALFSHYLKVAGRADLIAYYDGVLSIIDFKTSKTVKTEKDIEDYFIQETGYAIMFEERTGIPITNLVTIMVVDYSSKPLIFKQHRDKWAPELLKTIAMYYEKHGEN
jgi:hypothetical protein